MDTTPLTGILLGALTLTGGVAVTLLGFVLSTVSKLGDRVDGLGDRVDGLGEKVDRLGARLDDRLDRLTDRMDTYLLSGGSPPPVPTSETIRSYVRERVDEVIESEVADRAALARTGRRSSRPAAP